MIREMINTHVGYAKELLDEAYRRRGLDGSRISQRHVDYEHEVLSLVDGVFAPSAEVARSLEWAGVPASKVMRTSYGWEPARLTAGGAARAPGDDGFTALFVGSLGIRKGTDTLVRAWRASGIEGRLLLVGSIEKDAEHLVRPLLGGDVVHVPFTADVAGYYARADALVLPSLEEGSPLVTYEAAGAGLPVVATPMGAGNVLEHGRNGFVVPPDDVGALAQALCELAGSPELRQEFAVSSRRRAAGFTWQETGRRRAADVRRLVARSAAG